MSKTVIAQSDKQKHPGANQKYVNSRMGGPTEQVMTKNASIKHHNPEYFKRQTDRANKDNLTTGPIQRDFNHRQPNVGKDVGRGEGKVGRDQAPFQMKQFSKGTMY